MTYFSTQIFIHIPKSIKKWSFINYWISVHHQTHVSLLDRKSGCMICKNNFPKQRQFARVARWSHTFGTWFLWPCTPNLIKSNRNHPRKYIQILMVAHTHTHTHTHSPATKMQWISQSRLVKCVQIALAHPQTLNPPTYTRITCRHTHIIYFTQWDTCLTVWLRGELSGCMCERVLLSFWACSVQIQELTWMSRWIRIKGTMYVFI